DIHEEVCARGYDRDRNTFMQAYDRRELDASLLVIPLVGSLPASDPRVIGTVEAIERDLVEEGFVLRYRTESGRGSDGLPPGEGVFLAGSFRLAGGFRRLG